MPEPTPFLVWLHARDLPVFPALQTLALLCGGIVFGARLFTLRVIPGWPRDRRNAQLVHYAAAAACGCVLGAALLGPLLRVPGWIVGRVDPFAPGFMMAWGALGGASVAASRVARAHGVSQWRVLDALAPGLGALVAVGRIGCLLTGCCFGQPTGGAWAVAYPRATPAHADHVARGLLAPDALLSLPVRPIALVESMLGVVMVVFGFKLARRGRPGTAYLTVIALYAVGRLMLELWRADLGRGVGTGVASFVSLAALGFVARASLGRRDA